MTANSVDPNQTLLKEQSDQGLMANSFLLNIAEHENFSANKYENINYC